MCHSRFIAFAAVLLFILPLFGTERADVKIEPTTFLHPDEFLKGEGFGVLADRRIFAAMAFLNCVGYDEEYQGMRMVPTRVKVRERLQKNLLVFPEKLAAWKKYYSELHLKEHTIVHFALSMNTDYPFRRIRPRNELWYPNIGDQLAVFPAILNDFWATARLGEVWEEVKPDYFKEISKYDFKRMSGDMASLWGYLRLKREDNHMIVSVPNLLCRHYTSTGSRFDMYYYSIDGPGSNDYSLNTHEYLHPTTQLLLREIPKQLWKKLLPYYEEGKGKPAAESYGTPLGFVDECLVHALDARITIRIKKDDSYTRSAEQQVSELTRDGLLLTGPFFHLLKDYEASDLNFRQYLPILLEELPDFPGK